MAELTGAISGALAIVQGVISASNALSEQLGNYKGNPGKVENLQKNVLGLKEDLAALKGLLERAKKHISVECEGVLRRCVEEITERLKSLETELEDSFRHFDQPPESKPQDSNVMKRGARKFKKFLKARFEADDLDKWASELKENRKNVRVQVCELDSIVPKYEKYEFKPQCLVSNDDNVVLHFEDPETPEGKLRSLLLNYSTSGTSNNVVLQGTASSNMVGVDGMGGVGKTTILKYLAIDEQVTAKFPDGRFYMEFGRDASEHTVIKRLLNIVVNSNGEELEARMRGSESLSNVIDKVTEWFSSKKVLFLCDDLWPKDEKPREFVKDLKKILRCSSDAYMVFSTRSLSIAKEAGSIIRISSLEPRGLKAREILMCHSVILEREVEAGSSAERDLMSILDFCCGLPLALTVAGCVIKAFRESNRSIAEALSDVHSDLKEGRLRIVQKEEGVDNSFDRIVITSLKCIDSWAQTRLPFRGEEIHDLFRRLCIFQRRAEVPISVLRSAWGLVSPSDAQIFADKLADIGLLECRQAGKIFLFHDLIWDFTFHETSRLKGAYQKYHNDFIIRVAGCDQSRNDDMLTAGLSQLCCRNGDLDMEGYPKVESCIRPWWKILQQTRTDELRYTVSNIARHLRDGGRLGELAALLSRFEWIEYRRGEGGLSALSDDFTVFFQRGPMSESEGEKDLKKKASSDIRLIHNAMRSLWSYIVNEPSESFPQSLGTQALAHLLDVPHSGLLVNHFVESAKAAMPRPWLRPLRRFWPVPDGRQIVVLGDFVEQLAMNWKRDEGVAILETGEMIWIDFRGSTKQLASGGNGKRKKYVAWSKDGETVVVGYWNGMLEAWDGRSKTFARAIGQHCSLACLALSGNGEVVASGSNNGTVRLWSGKDGSIIGEPLGGHESLVGSVCVSEDGNLVASGSDDGTVRLWSGRDGSAIGKPLCGHEGWVLSVNISGDGNVVASSSVDGTVRLWSGKDGSAIGQPLRGHGNRVLSVSVSRDGNLVASGSEDCTIRLWSGKDGSTIGEPLLGHDGWVRSVSVSGDGNLVASASNDGTVQLWSRKDGNTIGEPLPRHELRVGSVSVSGDGNVVASGSDDGTIRLWSGKDGSEIGEPLRGSEYSILGVSISGDGNVVASGSIDGTVRLWSGKDGSAIGELLSGHAGRVLSVSVSGDGNVVASGSDDRTVRLWSGKNGGAIGEPLRGHEDWVWSVSVSGDGNLVASGSSDGTVRLWSGRDGSAIGKPLCGHEDWVWSVSVSGDGNIVASGSNDGTVRLWSGKDGSTIGEPLRGHEDWVQVQNVCVIGDGKVIVARCDKALYVWDVGNVLQPSGQTRDKSREVHCTRVTLPFECVSVGINRNLPMCGEGSSLRNRVVSAGLKNGMVQIFELIL